MARQLVWEPAGPPSNSCGLWASMSREVCPSVRCRRRTRPKRLRPIFLDVQVGDVVAVNPPREKAYLAQVLYVEGGARTSDPHFVQVCREVDCHVMNICPSWIIERLPYRPEPKPPQHLAKR